MAKVNVSLPQGTRDFNAEVVRKRNYIFSTIRSVFELYGFEPLETPAMENLETLMGKYGEEGDKLIFKILNNGLDNPAKEQQARTEFEKVLSGKNTSHITERALRYDLTIPFARYVAMNHNQLTMPFKRYQVQPVWRADRPQKGRYREFYQCDADVVGSQSLLNEVELAGIYATVFSKLGLTVEIKINNRRILAALAEVCGGADKMTDITVAIDKLDKIGMDKVKEELVQRGLNNDQIAVIEKYLLISGSNHEKLQAIQPLIGHTESGKRGIEEIETLLSYPVNTETATVVVDFTLARGLNYYTGIIFEVKAIGVQMGSIGGGGRYDDLTGLFGVPNIPGVGISFGVDRIYDVMEELKLFPPAIHQGTQVLFFNLGDAESRKAIELMLQLRTKNISCELFHEVAKMDKQFKYAEKKKINTVIIIGANELQNGTCNVKYLATGEQVSIRLEELSDRF
ncbi:MAG: histidine--tRNA ligase [Chitinophagaceae bacterium]